MRRWIAWAAVAGAGVAGLALAAASLGPRVGAEGGAKRAPSRTPDCVYVGTPYDVIDKMVDVAEIQPGDVVYDLGCGDARILVSAAKRHGCRCVGFDINPVRVDEALENARKNGVSDLVKVEERDIFTVDLEGATVVMLYLLPKMNERLIPQLKKLKPGARIVSHDYGIAGIREEKEYEIDSLEDGVRHYIYLYRAPLEEESSSEESS